MDQVFCAGRISPLHNWIMFLPVDTSQCLIGLHVTSSLIGHICSLGPINLRCQKCLLGTCIDILTNQAQKSPSLFQGVMAVNAR